MFAEGGRLPVPVDLDIALVVGTVALGYAQPPAAERRGQATPAPLVVVETERDEPVARALLAPLAVRGALRYIDVEGADAALPPVATLADELYVAEVRRQRVSPLTLQATEPHVAVLISPTRSALLDLAVLREFGVPAFVFRHTLLEYEPAAEFTEVEDPAGRLLHDVPEGRCSLQREPAVRPVLPYSYLMQRLVGEWTDRYG